MPYPKACIPNSRHSYLYIIKVHNGSPYSKMAPFAPPLTWAA